MTSIIILSLILAIYLFLGYKSTKIVKSHLKRSNLKDKITIFFGFALLVAVVQCIVIFL